MIGRQMIGRPAAWWLLAALLAIAHPAMVRAAGTVTLDTFDLPPGASVTLEFEVDVSASPTGSPACNQGQVRGDVDSNITTFLTDDPDTGPAGDQTCTPLQLLADLAITKTDGVTTAIPGTSLVYTIVASNAGPSGVVDGVVSDTFPAGLSCGWTSVAAGGATGNTNNPGPANLNQTGLTIPPSGSITYTVTCAIAPGATGTLSNTATISSAATTDPVPGNNSATDNNTVLTPQANVSITKTDGSATEVPGTPVTYTIVVSNAGPSNDPSVSVADTFPAALSGCGWTSVAAGGATGNTNNPGPANLANTLNMPVGSSVTYTATCNISPAATGTLANTATATTSVTDPTPGNNSATDTDTLTPQADVAVTKTDGAASEVPGTPVSYTITVSNTGPSNDPSVSVADTFPASLTGCGWTSVAAGGATGNTNNPGPAASLANTLDMPTGSSVTYTVNCNVAPNATGTLVNTVTGTASVTDPTPGNNSATDTDTLTPQVDLSITKTDGAATEIPGTPVVYTIVVANSGPSTDPSASVADTFPAILTSCGWTSVAAGGATGNTNNPGPANLANTLSLPPGSSVTYTVTCNIASNATGSLANTATVTASATDTNATNNSASDTDTLTPQADIAVDKDDFVSAVSPGGTTTYTIEVENLGPSDAPSVNVTDTFPATLTCSWTSVPNGATGNTNNPGPANLNDTLNMPFGSSVIYTVGCDVDGAATGTISNTASVTSTVTDPNAGNDSSTDVDTVLPLDYGDAPTAAQSGFPLSYPTELVADGARHVATGLTLGASRDIEPNGQPTANADGDDANGTTPDDEDGVVFTTALVACQNASAEVTASAGGGRLSAWLDWNRNGDWADPGEQIATDIALVAGSNTVNFTVPCSASLGDSYARFRLSTATGLTFTDQAADGEVEDYRVTITAVGDLSITKNDGLTSAVPGSTAIVYTIVASNAGPSPLAGVSVTDTFPLVLSCGWTSVAAGGATGNTNNPGPANLAETLSLPVSGSVTYTVTCSINPAATGTLSNTATIATTLANTSDPVPGNNSATDSNTVLTPQADVAITKTDGSATEVPGTPVTYTIVVTNNGPSVDPSVSVADTFPAALSGCGWTSVAAGGATGNTNNPGPANLANTLNMPVGSSVTYTATCNISATATGSLANTATATPSVTDPTPGNNSATDTDTLAAEADVSITKTDGAASEVPGTPVTYTIVVANAGPSADPNVTVADTFAATLTGCSWTSVAAGGATGNDPGPTAGNINDTGINLPVGGSVTYTATCNVAPNATGTLANTATATVSVTDPAPGNNSATDTDTLTPQADIAITKTDGAANEVPGTPVTYTIVVSNSGPSTDPSVSVADSFPAILIGCGWTSVPAGGATGNTNNPGPAASLANTLNLPPSSSVTYTVTCNVAPNATGTLVNTATATASVTDPTPGNNSATDTDTLSPETDLKIVKTANITVVQGGENFTYTLTVMNMGPSNASGVTITDNLPAEVTLTSTSGCAEDPNGIPTCTIGNLAVGATVPVAVMVTVDPAPLPNPSFDNTATVDGNETDPVPGNNSSTLTLSTDMTPPAVASTATAAGPLAGCGPTVRVAIDEISVVFSEELMASGGGPLGPNDADNPANYRLFTTGPDFAFMNQTCNSPQPGDVAITINGVSYQTATPAAPQSTATLGLNGGTMLPDGLYRLIVCGETGIQDLAGNQLDSDPVAPGAQDFRLDFRVDAGNLFQNGHFDCNDGITDPLLPWQELPAAGAEVMREADDADGSPHSGSAVVSSSGGTGFGIAQCAEVGVLQNPYALYGRVRVVTALSAFLGLNASCELFPGAGCTGASLGTLSSATSLSDTAGVWDLWGFTTSLNLPVGTVSVRCSLVISNPLAASFDVNLDQLTLESDGGIFSDGFESGDTSAWSAQVP